jgi:hypothetical protein
MKDILFVPFVQDNGIDLSYFDSVIDPLRAFLSEIGFANQRAMTNSGINPLIRSPPAKRFAVPLKVRVK